MEKIFITGGLGFIGSAFIRLFIEEYEIINYDVMTYCGNLDNVKDLELHPNYSFIQGDICDFKKVKGLLETHKPDAILHLAAESHVDRSIDGPIVFAQTNFVGTAAMLDAARQVGIPKFINMATDEIYGDLDLDSKKKFTEETPINPSSPYSAAKAGAKLLADAYWRTFKYPVISAASGNAFGPYQYPEKLIPLMVLKAARDEPLPVYGDGLNIRDWIYVEDLARALEVLIRKGEPGETYNISSRNEKSNIEIVKLLLGELKKPETLIHYVTDRKGHDRKYSNSNKKIKSLGWKPKITFKRGMEKTIKWYLKNEWWWRKLLKN